MGRTRVSMVFFLCVISSVAFEWGCDEDRRRRKGGDFRSDGDTNGFVEVMSLEQL